MLMTQTEMNQFLTQINQAFQDQFNKLEVLEAKVVALEDQMSGLRQKEDSDNAKGKRPKTSKSGRVGVQQAKEDA